MQDMTGTTIDLPLLETLLSLHQQAVSSKDEGKVRQIDLAIERLAAAEAAALEARILTVSAAGI